MAKKMPGNVVEIRDTLFGDMGMQFWPGEGGGGEEPWETFVAAREALAKGRKGEAIAAWRRVVEMKGLESRHYLQAWDFLRGVGEKAPAEKGKELLGVVLEVPLEGGVDLLAAYADMTARYYNHSGGGVVWDGPDGSLDASVKRLLEAGQVVLNAIGPWEGKRPGVPREGAIRMNFLSPMGLHFGEGPFGVLEENPMAKSVIEAGVALMERLIEKGRR